MVRGRALTGFASWEVLHSSEEHALQYSRDRRPRGAEDLRPAGAAPACPAGTPPPLLHPRSNADRKAGRLAGKRIGRPSSGGVSGRTSRLVALLPIPLAQLVQQGPELPKHALIQHDLALLHGLPLDGAVLPTGRARRRGWCRRGGGRCRGRTSGRSSPGGPSCGTHCGPRRASQAVPCRSSPWSGGVSWATRRARASSGQGAVATAERCPPPPARFHVRGGAGSSPWQRG